eukprot:CAMPEP_0117649344 /NCGR_PEP_ID=MMETSP0804-20121206/919_1 /TAXON_ID=1074897 /ORGANISM="Tetraselmis astigmatica, Strain CCMP880" /LENGTH=206 /DNA_ID=CAMNT_0005455069 /DNA_START=149 /DNA_END=769 /DNA_ORIENTATION=-
MVRHDSGWCVCVLGQREQTRVAWLRQPSQEVFHGQGEGLAMRSGIPARPPHGKLCAVQASGRHWREDRRGVSKQGSQGEWKPFAGAWASEAEAGQVCKHCQPKVLELCVRLPGLLLLLLRLTTAFVAVVVVVAATVAVAVLAVVVLEEGAEGGQSGAGLGGARVRDGVGQVGGHMVAAVVQGDAVHAGRWRQGRQAASLDAGNEIL